MALDIQTERRFSQIEFDVESIRQTSYSATSDTARLKSRMDWLLVVSIFGSTASLVLSLIVFVLVLVK